MDVMDLATYSPRKLQVLNQASPRSSTRKRSLFPSNSPQTNDLGLISELSSDDSEVFSPPMVSPSSSITPGKDRGSPMKLRIDKVLRLANQLEFSNSPRKSPRKISFGKENNFKGTRQSPRKSFKRLMEKENFDEHFITVLPDSPQKQETPVQFEKSLDNITTPKKNTSIYSDNDSFRSPCSDSKADGLVKPNTFYGNLAPILANNQTNRIQGMKCVFRPPHQPRAKAKLTFDEKPAKKRRRSKSTDAIREAKRRKPVFTGVHHAIPRPVKHSPPSNDNSKKETIREKARNSTDLSRTPYGTKKPKEPERWEYTIRFTKPMRYEDNLGEKRKFFKTSVRDSPGSTASSLGLSPGVPKKRKLLDTRKSYLTPPKEPVINTSDIAELIENEEVDKQDKPVVDDILLRLEEDDEEENKKEMERQMLMNILEDSPTKTAAIDSLSNCTASMDLNDSSPKSESSRQILDATAMPSTPRHMFSIFKKTPNSGISSPANQSQLSKKKWHGVGENQLQIDAGQKRFGATQCPECGMVYQAGEAEDEVQHIAFHNNFATLRHNGWKNENVVGRFGMDYAIVITENDPKTWQQKAVEVLAFVDKSLGISSDNPSVMHNQKVFLYISDKQIVGCMVAHPVSKAYKMISSESDVDICSEESYNVRCGVSRMWTLFTHRRQKIATKLLDSVRLNFMYGYILSKSDVAFSIPTPDGKRFAANYMESSNFYVYTGY